MTDIDAIRLVFSADSLMLLNVCLALVVFGLALDIRYNDFAHVLLQPRALVAGLLSQWLILPVVTCVLVLLLKPAPSIALGMILVSACPGGAVSNFYASLAGGNVALSITLSAFSSVAAFVVTPTVISVAGFHLDITRDLMRVIDIDFAALLATVTAVLVLPTLAGAEVARRAPMLAMRIRPIMRKCSMFFLFGFIVLALFANADIFLSTVSQIATLVIAQNALAFIAGWLVATAARLSDRDRRTVAIETGIQNTAFGLVLVFSFFDGIGGMALVAAVWGVWHLVSGAIVSFVFARRASREQTRTG